MKNQKTSYIGPNTGVGLVNHAVTPWHTHFSLIAMVETLTTSPIAGGTQISTHYAASTQVRP